MSRPISKVKLIGKEGGTVHLMGCRLAFPAHAFARNTPVCVSVRSQYVSTEHRVISPELRCSALDVPFSGLATISLPLHVVAKQGMVRIFNKKKNQSVWTELEVKPIIKNRSVEFQVSHFCWYKAVLKGIWYPSEVCICNYLFIKKTTAWLCGLTCIASEAVQTMCCNAFEANGYESVFELPDNIPLRWGEEMSYKFECVTPGTSQIIPDKRVTLENSAFNETSFFWRKFKIQPPPGHDTDVVEIQYSLSKPQSFAHTHPVPIMWNNQVGAAGGLGQDATATVPNVQVVRSERNLYFAHLQNDGIYKMPQHREKGKVLIINNEFRGTLHERIGSQIDVENLIALWRDLGFVVESKNNLGAPGMQRTCKEFAVNAVRVSALVVIIMTHGGRIERKEYLCGEDGGKVFSDEVISSFISNQCQHLQGIPKIFMFQACRGCNLDGDQTDDCRDQLDADVTRHPNRADMLICYPTQAGCTSFRDVERGSWLMNAVTNVFMQNAHEKHVLDLLIMVNHAVANRASRDGYVQMSNQQSYLRKNLFLFPGWPNS